MQWKQWVISQSLQEGRWYKAVLMQGHLPLPCTVHAALQRLIVHHGTIGGQRWIFNRSEVMVKGKLSSCASMLLLCFLLAVFHSTFQIAKQQGNIKVMLVCWKYSFWCKKNLINTIYITRWTRLWENNQYASIDFCGLTVATVSWRLSTNFLFKNICIICSVLLCSLLDIDKSLLRNGEIDLINGSTQSAVKCTMRQTAGNRGHSSFTCSNFRSCLQL